MRKIFFFFFLFFLGSLASHAQTVSVVTRPSGIISTKTIRGKRIETELNYIYINGEIAYCIEPGVALGFSYIQSEDFLSVGIGSVLKKELELITYYGYAYEGHNSPYYYAATQTYIWEKMGATDVVFTQNGQVIDIQPYKDEIFRLFWTHDTLPSFASKNYEIYMGEELSLTDQNGVLSRFQTKSKNVQINGETITVSGLAEGKSTISFTQKKKEGKSLVYFAPSNQNIATFTLDDVYTKKFDFTVEVKKKRGRIKIQKVDQNTREPLSDAEFYLYDDSGIAIKGKTDKDGILIFDNLVYGNYTLKEIEAPRGYILDDTIQEISLDKKEVSISVFNEKHLMPVTSDMDRGYRVLFSILSSLGVSFLYVSKKTF